MNTTRRRNQAIYTITIPMKEKERELLDSFCKKQGLKKGFIVRKAILEYLEKVEGENNE